MADKIKEHQSALVALDQDVPSSDSKGSADDHRVRVGCFAVDCTPLKQKVRRIHEAVLKGLFDRLREAILTGSTNQVSQSVS